MERTLPYAVVSGAGKRNIDAVRRSIFELVEPARDRKRDCASAEQAAPAEAMSEANVP
jgi:hypothetical protein